MITVIAAVDLNWGIGLNGSMPWKLPEDLKHFRELTMGNPVLMGRATYTSIGKPLEGRKNIVLSASPHTRVPRKDGLVTASSIKEALDLCSPLDNTFVIGGESIYKLFLPHADQIELTFINAKYGCDRTFPHPWPDTLLTSSTLSGLLTSKTGLQYRFGSYALSHSKQHIGKEVFINTYLKFTDED